MKAARRKRVGWVLGAVLIGLAGWLLLHERTRRQRAAERLRATEQEIVAARAEIVARAKRLEFIEQSSKRKEESAPVTKAQTTPSSRTRPAPVRPWLSRVLAEHPRLHALYLDAYRWDLEARHGYALKALGVSAEDAARVIEILARDMERASDIAAATRAQNMSAADEPIKTLEAERVRDREEALQTLLGPERLKAWRTTQNFMLVETLHETIASLHATAMPLTFEQSLALKGILEGPDARNEWSPSNPASHARVEAEAARVLSPEQLAVFQMHVQARLAREQITELGRRSRAR